MIAGLGLLGKVADLAGAMVEGKTAVKQAEAQTKMPGWYQYSLGGIVSASIGMRGVSKYYGGKK